VINLTGSWLLALPVSALSVAVLGSLMERLFLRRVACDALRQVLLTVGFALLLQQAALDIWGGDNMDINVPAALD
jgi:branched-chain amino acid transport system permease protein